MSRICGGWGKDVLYVTVTSMFYFIYTLICPQELRVLLWELGFVFTNKVAIHWVLECGIVVMCFTRTHTSLACVSLINIAPVSVPIVHILMSLDHV